MCHNEFFSIDRKMFLEARASHELTMSVTPSEVFSNEVLTSLVNGPVWSFMMPYGLIWSSMVPYGPPWYRMILYGPLWSSMAPYGPLWSLMVPYDPQWFLNGP